MFTPTIIKEVLEGGLNSISRLSPSYLNPGEYRSALADSRLCILDTLSQQPSEHSHPSDVSHVADERAVSAMKHNCAENSKESTNNIIQNRIQDFLLAATGNLPKREKLP